MENVIADEAGSAKIRAAFHEAGHSCAHLIFGRKVVSAKLKLENGCWGGVVNPEKARRTNPYRHAEIRAHVERELIVACAGIVSELKLVSPEGEWYDTESLLHDLAFILDGPIGPPPILGVEDDYQRVTHLLDLLVRRCFVNSGQPLSDALRNNVRDFAIVRTVEIMNHWSVWRTVKTVAVALYEKEKLTGEEIEEIARDQRLKMDDDVRQFPRFHFADTYPSH